MLVAAAADMTGIELVSVTGISSDGQWFTGVATTPTTPAGETVGFIRQYCDDAIGAACSTVATPPFGVGAASDTLAVAAGQSASVVLTITPAAGFSDAERFACAGLPVGGSCSFAQRPVPTATGTPAGTSSVTVTATSDSIDECIRSSAVPAGRAWWTGDRPGVGLASTTAALGRTHARKQGRVSSCPAERSSTEAPWCI